MILWLEQTMIHNEEAAHSMQYCLGNKGGSVITEWFFQVHVRDYWKVPNDD